MKNPFRIRTRVVQIPKRGVMPAHYVIEYRRWWQLRYHLLMETPYYPSISYSRIEAESVIEHIHYWL